MVVALSRFKVANGREGDVRDAFLNRPGLVENAPGFLGLEVFTDAADPSLFYLITRWTDPDSFRRWHAGPDHHRAHQGIPKGLKLDPSFTQLLTLDRISGPGTYMPADGVRDSAFLISEFLHRSASVHWLQARPDGVIVVANEAFRNMFAGQSLEGALVWPLLTEPDAANLRGAVSQARREPSRGYRLNFIGRDRMPVTLECHIDVQPDWFALIGEPLHEDETRLQLELMTLNNRLAVELRENDRKAKALRHAKARLEKALIELTESQRLLTNIQEVLPICMGCGKVKNQESKWEAVVEYFQRNNLLLSHGYCPNCYQKEMEKLDP